MLQSAQEILENGFTKLKDSYVQNFPLVKYDPTLARCRLLQMPLVCIRVDYSRGRSECLLLEHVSGVNYSNMRTLLHKVVSTSNFKSPNTMVSKSVVKSLLGLCQSDRENVFAMPSLSHPACLLPKLERTLDLREWLADQRRFNKLLSMPDHSI